MDIFVEYLIKKQLTMKEKALKALTVIGAVVVATFLILASMLLGSFAIFALLAAAGAVYGGYLLFTSFNIEYEYIVTNGEMDVDKIIAQRKRKRLVTVRLRDLEVMAPVNGSHAGEYKSTGIKTRIEAGNPDVQGAYFLNVRHDKLGMTQLVFQPDGRIIEIASKAAPRKVFTE